MCNICNQYNCCCNSVVATNTTIVSDQAGREGLSAKDLAILTGKFSGGTDAQFVDWNKGAKGDKGDQGIKGDPGDVSQIGLQTVTDVNNSTTNDIKILGEKKLKFDDSSIKESKIGRDHILVSRDTTLDAGSMHIEPNEYFDGGTKSKLDLMFDPYELNQSNYRILGFYCDDDWTKGTDGVVHFNVKSTGANHFGMFPMLDVGFNDNNSNGGAFKVVYMDHSETVWRTNFKGAWRSGKVLSAGDVVIASVGMYSADSSGICGNTQPSHESGSVSDGNISFTFIKKWTTSTQIKATTLFGDRSQMPLFGFPGARVQFAGDALWWNNRYARYLDNTGSQIGVFGAEGNTSNMRWATSGGLSINLDNSSDAIIIKKGVTEVARILSTGQVKVAQALTIDQSINFNNLSTQFANTFGSTNKINIVNASTTIKGVVNQAAASSNTAPVPSSTYSQTEVQAILTELRDLKTKLRTAGILEP